MCVLWKWILEEYVVKGQLAQPEIGFQMYLKAHICQLPYLVVFWINALQTHLKNIHGTKDFF
jgi:hypothetical protein